MPFRDDILRGVRLFLIVFAAILVCVAGYRYLRTPLEAHGADAPPPQAEAAPPDSAASVDPAADPAADPASETHPAVVPPPPELKAPAARVTRARVYDVPPPPPPAPVTRSRRAPESSGREFESAEPIVLPAAAPVVKAEEPAPASPKQEVGYKSLLEVNADRLPTDPALPAPDPEQKPKSNRFIKALGKIFHPGKQDQ